MQADQLREALVDAGKRRRKALAQHDLALEDLKRLLKAAEQEPSITIGEATQLADLTRTTAWTLRQE